MAYSLASIENSRSKGEAEKDAIDLEDLEPYVAPTQPV